MTAAFLGGLLFDRSVYAMKKILSVLLGLAIVMPLLLFCPARAEAAEFDVDFETASKSIYLENLDTGTLVFSKDANTRRYPASTTKIMTYVVTADHVADLKNTYVTVKGEIIHSLDGTGSSMADLKEDETLSVYQLLNCMMIPSGNDAALVLADYVGGGNIDVFVKMMNDKAKELECEDTHFANPNGLHDDNHYTTVSDMAKITKYALTLPGFVEITNTVTYEIEEGRNVYTTNKMLNRWSEGDYYYEYAQGVKTGFTDEAGYCLVSTAQKGGFSYLCVAYGAPDTDENGEDLDNGAMLDSKKLYEWAFDNLTLRTIIDKNDLVKEIDLGFAWNKDKLQLAPKNSYPTILPKDVELSGIERTFHLPDHVDAPVKKGEKIGTVTLSYDNKELATIDLISAETVDRSEWLTFWDSFFKTITSFWFVVSVVSVASLIFIYAVVVAIYRHKKKKQRPVKKYRKF